MVQDNTSKRVKKLNKNMIVECPELNFLTDQILSGTMIQVGRDI